jgi:hypothetical protein
LAGRTPERAVEEILDVFRRVALCITDRPVLASGYRPSSASHSLSFAPRGEPVLLASDGRRRRIGLFFSHLFRLVAVGPGSADRWRVRSAGYVFDALDPDGREILTYHWHPEAAGPDYAHLHLSGRLAPLDAGQGFEPVALGEPHLPTERITFAAIVRLLITEFRIAPQRSDWAVGLDQADRAERRIWID